MPASPTAPRVVVVILTWNRVDDLVTCLESFDVVTYPNYEVLVVDNASQDETVSVVRERFGWVQLLVNDENLGYVGGNNVGIRWALEHGADYVFVLNSDTKMTPDVLDQLVATLEADPHAAIAGAKNLMMEFPEFTWGKYGKLTWGPLLVFTVGRFELDTPEDRSPKEVEWVIGNGCLIRRRALEEVGLFDETFFQVNEDVDWSMRARAIGYRTLYVDTAAIHHKGGSSADPKQILVFSYGYFLGRNAIMFARKYARPWHWAKLVPLMLFGMTMRAATYVGVFGLYALMGQRPWVYGAVDGFRRRLRRDRTVGPSPFIRQRPRTNTLVRFFRWIGA